MNWIFIGMFIILAQHKLSRHKINGDAGGGGVAKGGGGGIMMALATPLPQGHHHHGVKINPYIRHWEAAHYDRSVLEEAHRRRKKRHLEQDYHQSDGDGGAERRRWQLPELSGGNVVKLKIIAHDRDFHLLLRQDPSSVFAPDFQIENTLGPVDYDVSRVYSGIVEDDENSHVHGILTADNLFDGTISTNFEQYYIEPSHRYSNDLPTRGIHSIVYKLSDVHMDGHHKYHNPEMPLKHNYANAAAAAADANGNEHNNNLHYCASERFYRKMKNDKSDENKILNNLIMQTNINQIINKYSSSKNSRHKSSDRNFSSGSEASFGPMEDGGIDGSKMRSSSPVKRIFNKRRKRWLPDELAETQNPPLPLDLDVPYNDDFSIVNPDSNSNLHINSNTNNQRTPQLNPNNRPPFGILQRNKNILINNYNPNSDFNLRANSNNRNIIVNNYDNNNNNGNPNTNNINRGASSINIFNNNMTSRPSHKTHVEIITKHGATKKPNILLNNYNPDVILTNSNYNINSNGGHHHSNINLNVRNDLGSGMDPRNAYDRKSTCMLYLQADHTFFQKMGSDEASIEAITRHVQRANTIYKNTDFNGDGKPDNITFMIKRIKVHNLNALKDPTYRFPGNYGVEKFLELFSEEDYDAFCLAYMFTYRDFEMGTLGLAWTGDLKNAGGVCEKNGHYRGSLKSLNTGIVTLLNYGKHVPPAVSHVTLAHEIGHNFGSPHDPEQCTPGGEDGNFIMFARATSGDKKNNNKFSPCSLKSIEPVLNAKARSSKGCFTERQQSICGNGVVEQDEECDCGWEEDCQDDCCYPMSRHPILDEKPCTLTPKSRCSPSQGPCCTTDCSLKFGDKCRDDNGCRDPSYCDGGMPQCPPSINKPNKTICNKEFVCYMGECTGSICLAYGLESCQCIPTPSDPKTKACELCCKIPGENNPCKSSFEWNEIPYDVPDMYAKPGTPCNDYNGYCDVFQKCREVDPSGPLATLRKLLLSEESIASFKKWMLSNWYTVVLVVIAVFVLLILSAKFLGKKSNLKLKSVTIIHSATTETVRLPDDNNGVIIHTAIRSKVPLKKKVRGERKTKSSKDHLINKVKKRGQKLTASSSNNNNNNNAESPKKLAAKKKKRVSAPIVAEEQQQQSQSTKPAPEPTIIIPPKAKKAKKSKSSSSSSKHKEIIDYSSRAENHTNTFGKVQKWLLESPIVASATGLGSSSQIEHSSKVTNILSKSQSTPERLTQRSPKKIKSVSNLNEKVKLQVVYKPPFKLSLKLSKNNGVVKTQVLTPGVMGRSKRGKRSSAFDKKRVGVDASQRRTALLIRTEEPDPVEQSEPNYETLTPKKVEKNNSPVYENINGTGNSSLQSLSPPTTTSTINSATFRINKSASGGNIMAHMNPKLVSNRRGSSSNINQVGPNHHQVIKRRSSVSTSNTNLNQNLSGSSSNLIRSSTTNLSKQNSSLERNNHSGYDLNRSSTANLTKSNSNSKKSHFDPEFVPYDGRGAGESSRSRRNSTNMKSTDSTSKNSISRISNSSSGKIMPPMKRGSISNIPRASLKNNFGRQQSLQVVPPKKNAFMDSGRPLTSGVDPSKFGPKNPFEWPKILSPEQRAVRDDPLPSDLEVFVSDVENLVHDN